MQVWGWAQTAGQEGCEKSRPTQVLYPQTFQAGTSCYSNYGIMNLLDIATGAVFIVDVCKVCEILLPLRITHALFSPVSVYNTLYLPPDEIINISDILLIKQNSLT
jgi:transcription elongation factor Elf1